MESCGMDPQGLEKFFNVFLSSGWKVVEWTPQIWHLMEILQILHVHVQYNDTFKFAITLFPIGWGPFEDVNLLYFLLKMQIWNGCNVLNIARNPIKDINVNLSFPSSRWKVVEWTPPGLEKFLNVISEFSIKSCWMEPTLDLTSGGNFGNSTFPGTVHWCMQICHKPFFPSAEGHLKMLIYSIFYWKCRFEMAVMCLILQETPLKISM